MNDWVQVFYLCLITSVIGSFDAVIHSFYVLFGLWYYRGSFMIWNEIQKQENQEHHSKVSLLKASFLFIQVFCSLSPIHLLKKS